MFYFYVIFLSRFFTLQLTVEMYGLHEIHENFKCDQLSNNNKLVSVMAWWQWKMSRQIFSMLQASYKKYFWKQITLILDVWHF